MPKMFAVVKETTLVAQTTKLVFARVQTTTSVVMMMKQCAMENAIQKTTHAAQLDTSTAPPMNTNVSIQTDAVMSITSTVNGLENVSLMEIAAVKRLINTFAMDVIA